MPFRPNTVLKIRSLVVFSEQNPESVMETQQLKSTIEKAGERPEEKKLKKQEGVNPVISPASPPSASSSPSHEFSFTVSLHSSSSSAPGTDKAKSSFAVDLTPADEIFFHGHLLPLHLLSHLPVSPRSSINSLDSFTLPIKELLYDDEKPITESTNCSNSSNKINAPDGENRDTKVRNRGNKQPFSLFGWKKGFEEEDKDKKKKLRFDVTHVLKRYVRMVRPLLSFKGRRENLQFNRQAYSFSGNNLSWRNNKRDLRGRRGEYSAPASMRTSPTNSGLLGATATATLPSTSDSTMEELQAAIQAAIAHCKNSSNPEEDKIKC